MCADSTIKSFMQILKIADPVRAGAFTRRNKSEVFARDGDSNGHTD